MPQEAKEMQDRRPPLSPVQTQFQRVYGARTLHCSHQQMPMGIFPILRKRTRHNTAQSGSSGTQPRTVVVELLATFEIGMLPEYGR